MTVGILCMDGMDARLTNRYSALQSVPTSPTRLTNDLSGRNPLFTPRVWTSLFAGEDQTAVTGWHPQDDWEDATDHLTFLWDKVPGSVVFNVNCHTHYIHRNTGDVVPDGWTPTHGSYQQIRDTTMQQAELWNDLLQTHEPGLLVGYVRGPDAWGHRAVQQQDADAWDDCYGFLRDDFFPALDLPDRFVIVSDHGFVTDPTDHDSGSGKGKDMHEPPGVLASNFLDYGCLTDMLPQWHGDVLSEIRKENMEALGYL